VQGRLRQYGIEDLYQDFYWRDDVFLVAPRTPYYLDLLAVTSGSTTVSRWPRRSCSTARASPCSG
jgi:hypothetical protein